MHNPVSVMENETHNLLLDFEIQTDHVISARRPDDQNELKWKKQNKKTNKKKKTKKKNKTKQNKTEENLLKGRLCCLGWPQSTIEKKWTKG